jgi:hypothetical protein
MMHHQEERTNASRQPRTARVNLRVAQETRFACGTCSQPVLWLAPISTTLCCVDLPGFMMSSLPRDEFSRGLSRFELRAVLFLDELPEIVSSTS